ncbi:MAG: 16S rRNA (guanine(966)-N(2))-methyltransferase RsmD [Chlamydiae bacterium]|nr:16S rRNA (guanine(966)-N(2))-methyltransferase RsmD [Chlamydiota bacterium]
MGGFLKGRALKAPKSIRPASSMLRQAVFNICQNLVENSNFLDIFAGSGAMGIEALSRGAEFATFIDNGKESINFIIKNLESFNLQNHSKIIFGDALQKVEKLKNIFDIITIDPPFIFFESKPGYINDILNKIVDNKLLSTSGIIFLEEPSYSKRDTIVPSLFLKDTRRFGGSLLHQYVTKNT